MKSEFVDVCALRRICARSFDSAPLALRAAPAVSTPPTIGQLRLSTLANVAIARLAILWRALRCWHATAQVAAAWMAVALATAPADAQVEMPEINISDPVTIAADSGSRFTQGGYEVLILKGNCYINQGLTYARSQEAALWVERTGGQNSPQFKIIAYLEGDVTIDYQQGAGGVVKTDKLQARVTDKTWFGRFTTNIPLTIHIDKVAGEPAVKPAVFQRGLKARDPATPDAPGGLQFTSPAIAGSGAAMGGVLTAVGTGGGMQDSSVQPAQLAVPNANGSTSPAAGAPGTSPEALPGMPPPAQAAAPPPPGSRRLRAFPRSDARVQAQLFPNPAANEQIVVVTSGINLIVDGMVGYGSIDVAADRVVIWKQGAAPDLTGQSTESDDTPLELYMEGNVVFRQGDRVIYADRIYYDVRTKRGLILQAEVLTPAPSYAGLLRLRADVLRQVDENTFVADSGRMTSSRLGVPTYEFRASQLTFTDVQQPATNFFGQPQLDPATGEPVIEHQRLATSKNNLLFLGPVPVFYWPYMATNLEEPSYYIQRALVRQDTIFGTQALVTFNAYQLLGMKRPPGTTWTASVDYFSLRGPAAGTQFRFDRPDFLGLVPGRNFGILDAWGIDDRRGYDTLGRDRRMDTFNNPERGRVLLRDRQMLPNNFQFTAEVGYISDRNFLEQYFEMEWDTLKDQNTGFELKQYIDNSTWSLTSDVRVNNFFTDTNWLPRLDHYLLGQSLFGDRLTWFEHTDVGYGQFRVLTAPTSAEDQAIFQYLPWEIPGGQQGSRLVSRQEIDLPFSVGAVKFTPYLLGELGHWGQVLNGNDLNRAYGQAGVRASVPFWAVNPTIENQFFNVHGVAHKVVLEADVFAMEATQNVTSFPLYDNLDDNNIDAFRRQFGITTFGGMTPTQLDPRFYAIRAGLAGDVASPVAEIANDLMAVRLGAKQRWQTKRGAPANRKVVDWITLDTQLTIFPDAVRDDFGAAVGMLNYDFNWNVGDRVTVMSDGFYDFFANGAKYTTIGAFLSRPPRGTLYAGVRSLAGPLHSTVVVSSYSYRMSPKWFSSFGTSYAFGGQGNIGQNVNLTRIGEAFLMSVGANVDASKGNYGFTFGIEPRFLGTKGRGYGATPGALVPPAGVFGLE